jgi:hypothetical protein
LPERTRDEKVEYLLAIQERERREREAPLISYKPHPGQTRAHNACREKRVTIVTSGNRWGKSHMNAAEIVSNLLGYRPWEVENLTLTPEGNYPPREEVPPQYWLRRGDEIPLQMPARVLCTSGLSMLQGIGRTMWPKIEGFIPPAVRAHPDYKVRRGVFSVPVEVAFPNDATWKGAKLFFASGEMKPMQFEGQNFTFAAFDEPTLRTIFGAIWRGLTDDYSRVIMTMTPIGSNAPWVFEEFEEGDRTDSRVISGSIWENPHIPDEAKKEFLEGGGFLDEERQARELGSWTFLSHRAFPMFDPAVHVVPEGTPLPHGWVRGMACDPAHRRPFMIVWALFGPNGEMLIYDEWPRTDHNEIRSSMFTVPDYQRIIINAEGGHQQDFRLLDPRSGAARPASKGEQHTSIQDDFAKEGLFFDCRLEGTEREETGIEKIRQLLRFDRNAPISPLNCPKLQVKANCINSINALRLSNFKPASMRDPDQLDEKTLQKFKDARDCIRYLALQPVHMGTSDSWSYIEEHALEEENEW